MQIHPKNYESTVGVPGFVGGFPVYLDDEVADRWAIKTVAQLISPAPGTSRERIKKIEELIEETRGVLFKFFRYPNPNRTDEVVGEIERVFDKTEWASLFHLPNKKYEVKFWINRNLIEAEHALTQLIGVK